MISKRRENNFQQAIKTCSQKICNPDVISESHCWFRSLKLSNNLLFGTLSQLFQLSHLIRSLGSPSTFSMTFSNVPWTLSSSQANVNQRGLLEPTFEIKVSSCSGSRRLLYIFRMLHTISWRRGDVFYH